MLTQACLAVGLWGRLDLDAEGKRPTKRDVALPRVLMAARELSDEELRLVAMQIGALAKA